MLRASLLAAAILAAAPNCTDLYSVGAHGFQIPKLAVQSARADQVGQAFQVVLDFQTHNPNPYPLTVSSVDYQVTLQGVPIFSGSKPGLSVEGTSDGSVMLTGEVPFASPALTGLTPGKSATYVLSGTLHVDSPAGVPVDVDYSTSGIFLVPALTSSGR